MNPVACSSPSTIWFALTTSGAIWFTRSISSRARNRGRRPVPLEAPNLDDRNFQDILDEARRNIPRYCPEWTDHNLSDPGITLLELFAWMTDLLIYRLNRVPDKNYIKFLDLIGLQLEPPRVATA